jgi:hypothetical protein
VRVVFGKSYDSFQGYMDARFGGALMENEAL